jgi:hypothetical protein
MQLINIRLMKLKVNSFSPRTKELSMSLTYDDGAKAREFVKNVAITDPNQLAADFMAAVRSEQKKINYVQDDDSLLAGHINVRIEKEEAHTEKLSGYLRTLREKAEKLARHNKADGYLKLIDDMRRLEFNF